MHPVLSLPAELSVYTVSELRPQFLTWLHESPDVGETPPDGRVRVDAAAVAEVDAAGVQLLLSLSNELARHDRVLQLVNPSPRLSQACTALGVSGMLATAELPGGAR